MDDRDIAAIAFAGAMAIGTVTVGATRSPRGRPVSTNAGMMVVLLAGYSAGQLLLVRLTDGLDPVFWLLSIAWLGTALVATWDHVEAVRDAVAEGWRPPRLVIKVLVTLMIAAVGAGVTLVMVKKPDVFAPIMLGYSVLTFGWFQLRTFFVRRWVVEASGEERDERELVLRPFLKVNVMTKLVVSISLLNVDEDSASWLLTLAIGFVTWSAYDLLKLSRGQRAGR